MRKLLYIKWIDSVSLYTGGWHSFEDIEGMEPTMIDTVGYLIKETKDYITVASSLNPFEASGDICIPKVCIKQKKIIKEP